MAKVLIVDNDRTMRSALAELLACDGHEIVGRAADGLQALELLENGCSPDVIVLDLEMPGMNGREFLAALEERSIQAPPIVIFSADLEGAPRSRLVVESVAKIGVDPELLCKAVRAAQARAPKPGKRRHLAIVTGRGAKRPKAGR
jgi:CheY-like chemotaxis protein